MSAISNSHSFICAPRQDAGACCLTSLCVIAAVAGAIIVFLGAMNVFGAKTSASFALSIGGGGVLAASGALSFLTLLIAQAKERSSKNSNASSSVDEPQNLQKQLYDAVVNGDLNEIRNTLDQGAHWDYVDGRGNRPIHWAAALGNIEAVKCFIDQGECINIPGASQVTVFHLLCKRGNVENVRWALGMGANSAALDSDEKSPLYYAVLASNAEAVYEIVAHLSNKNLSIPHAEICLACAVNKPNDSSVDIIKALLPFVDLKQKNPATDSLLPRFQFLPSV